MPWREGAGMSGDSTAMAVTTGHRPGEEPSRADVQTVLDALADPDCRAILRAIGPSALTANECSERCDLPEPMTASEISEASGVPLSTTYRKLELLAEADLVSEELRLRLDGKHASQYRRRVEAVEVAVAEDGSFDLALTDREAPATGAAPGAD